MLVSKNKVLRTIHVIGSATHTVRNPGYKLAVVVFLGDSPAWQCQRAHLPGDARGCARNPRQKLPGEADSSGTMIDEAR